MDERATQGGEHEVFSGRFFYPYLQNDPVIDHDREDPCGGVGDAQCGHTRRQIDLVDIRSAGTQLHRDVGVDGNEYAFTHLCVNGVTVRDDEAVRGRHVRGALVAALRSLARRRGAAINRCRVLE